MTNAARLNFNSHDENRSLAIALPSARQTLVDNPGDLHALILVSKALHSGCAILEREAQAIAADLEARRRATVSAA